MKGLLSWGLGLFLMTAASGAAAQSGYLYWSVGAENGLPTGLFCGEQPPKSLELKGPKGGLRRLGFGAHRLAFAGQYARSLGGIIFYFAA